MTIGLAIAIWVGASALCTPLIGYFLSTLHAEQAAERSLERRQLSIARRASQRYRSAASVSARRDLGQSRSI